MKPLGNLDKYEILLASNSPRRRQLLADLGIKFTPCAIDGIDESNYEDYGIVFYYEGICYYTYWIRHADDGDPAKISPMEYAIVRNNIYQLNVRSINGIGSVTPTGDTQVLVSVYVEDWTDIPTNPVEW